MKYYQKAHPLHISSLRIGVCIFTINKTMTMNPPIYNANVKR